MFRIRAHRYINNEGEHITILRSGKLQKKIKITKYDLSVIISSDEEDALNQENHWLFMRNCKDIIRDRLYEIHGKNWRKYQQSKMIWASTFSAYKRMKTISQPTGS